MTKPTQEKRVVYRKSDDGQFTTKKYAETHKPTTERQHVPVKPPALPNKPTK